MKTFLIVIMLFFISFSAFAQEIISSAGHHAEASGIQLDWTIGEPVIETYSNGNDILTQGFHQTKLMVTPVFSIIENNFINVFPNPTKELVYIQFNEILDFGVAAELHTLEGKLLKTFELIDQLTPCDVRSLPNGSYLLKISKNNEWIQSFKIIKMY